MKFKNVKTGEYFYFANRFYVKTVPITDEEEDLFNAFDFNFSNGRVYTCWVADNENVSIATEYEVREEMKKFWRGF